ncbi:hypothetical protein FRC10_004263 [Ceratobasidium sp. 414]|nr:hypothetical protein FRC10_004263 [Ceratobasidium sp. 414]
MSSALIQCILLLASYLLLISEDDDEAELAFSILSLGQALLVYNIKSLIQRRRRRGPYTKDRTQAHCDRIMNRESERTFKEWFRVNRATFTHLLNLIKEDAVFRSKGRKPQLPARYQLAAFLARFGSEMTGKIGITIGISVGSVYHACNRVTRAIRRIRHHHLSWPSPEARMVSKVNMQELGFPGAIGAVDGSLIPLKDKPRSNPWSYWSRKQMYALAMQAIVDFSARFIAFDLGWPGCTNDTTMWKLCHVWRRRHIYFLPDEWLMADKGYPISRHAIRPFAQYDLTDDPQVAQTRKSWNRSLSTQRVVVEHAFGQLKGRFPALRMMPGWDLPRMYRSIEALLAIHNICVDLRDRVEDIDGADIIDDQLGALAQGAAPYESQNVIRAAGLARRKRLVDYWVVHH